MNQIETAVNDPWSDDATMPSDLTDHLANKCVDSTIVDVGTTTATSI